MRVGHRHNVGILSLLKFSLAEAIGEVIANHMVSVIRLVLGKT